MLFNSFAEPNSSEARYGSKTGWQ